MQAPAFCFVKTRNFVDCRKSPNEVGKLFFFVTSSPRASLRSVFLWWSTLSSASKLSHSSNRPKSVLVHFVDDTPQAASCHYQVIFCSTAPRLLELLSLFALCFQSLPHTFKPICIAADSLLPITPNCHIVARFTHALSFLHFRIRCFPSFAADLVGPRRKYRENKH